jgi:hypothetical protein
MKHEEDCMHITGGCLCGAVRFAGEAEPQFQAKCYCVDCRRTSGGGHAAMMGFRVGDIRFTGEAKEFASKADSGNDAFRAFCPTCGSGIYARNGGMPGLIFLRASALDDPNLFSPQMIVWAARAPAWDPVNEGVPAFATSPMRAEGATS